MNNNARYLKRKNCFYKNAKLTKFYYLFSYVYESESGVDLMNRVMMHSTNPIKTHEQLCNAEKEIEENWNLKRVRIINYQLINS